MCALVTGVQTCALPIFLPHEYERLARHDARVAVVPILRFFDGTGLHIHDFLRHGILPGIGTDAPLVSDCQSPFEAMRLPILAQNIAVKKERADGRPPTETRQEEHTTERQSTITTTYYILCVK